MPEFTKVAAVADIPDPGKDVFEVDETLVILIHAGGQFYCLDDVCTHDGEALGEGELTENAIACPRHGAKFDIKTGKPRSMPATEATRVHDVKVENGDVYVRIDDD